MIGQIFFFLAYQLIQLFMIPAIVVVFVLRKLRGKVVFGSFKQRMGFVPSVVSEEKSIWIHAVSVGEILATQQLIKELKTAFPNAIMYVTTGTQGGMQVAMQQLQADVVSFMPYDFLLPMLIAFRRIKPVIIVGVEAEIWPNFLLLASFKQVRMYLLNGRINESHKWLKQLFFRLLYRTYSHIYAQTSVDKFSYELFGVSPEKVTVFGNIKAYNVQAKKEALRTKIILSSKDRSPYCVLMVGSAHHGECALYLSLFYAMRKKYDHVRLIFAPRHFSWQQDLIVQVKQQGLSYYLWDTQEVQLQQSHDIHTKIMQEIFTHNDVLLVCTLGKLFDLYPLADIFLLGGTFVPIGGHNLLEPAVWGIPMIIGPHYQNTQVIADALEHDGALYKTINEQALRVCVENLIKNSKKRFAMGHNAAAWLDREAAHVSNNLRLLFNEINCYHKEI